MEPSGSAKCVVCGGIYLKSELLASGACREVFVTFLDLGKYFTDIRVKTDIPVKNAGERVLRGDPLDEDRETRRRVGQPWELSPEAVKRIRSLLDDYAFDHSKGVWAQEFTNSDGFQLMQ